MLKNNIGAFLLVLAFSPFYSEVGLKTWAQSIFSMILFIGLILYREIK